MAIEKLSTTEFKTVVKLAPLVSIDLLIVDQSGRMLVGRRTNSPAKGSWFVPGGRIYKNEIMAAALTRISGAELGVALPKNECIFDSLHEHFYSDDFTDDPDASTHYVVLAHRVNVLDGSKFCLAKDQHVAFRWMSKAEALHDMAVHVNTRVYFARL